METKLITKCCPLTKFAEISKIASKMAAENRKLNISDCMAGKTEIPSAKHTFVWSSNAMETKLITICCPITQFAPIIDLYTFNHFIEQRWKSPPFLHHFFQKRETHYDVQYNTELQIIMSQTDNVWVWYDCQHSPSHTHNDVHGSSAFLQLHRFIHPLMHLCICRTPVLDRC